MSIYAWGTVFSGETVLWTDVEHETITFSGGTILSNPAEADDYAEQEVTIGAEEYNFGSSRELWTALWDWAVATADAALSAANAAELERIEADLASFVIE